MDSIVPIRNGVVPMIPANSFAGPLMTGSGERRVPSVPGAHG